MHGCRQFQQIARFVTLIKGFHHRGHRGSQGKTAPYQCDPFDSTHSFGFGIELATDSRGIFFFNVSSASFESVSLLFVYVGEEERSRWTQTF